jgi:hypothetical protein
MTVAVGSPAQQYFDDLQKKRTWKPLHLVPLGCRALRERFQRIMRTAMLYEGGDNRFRGLLVAATRADAGLDLSNAVQPVLEAVAAMLFSPGAKMRTQTNELIRRTARLAMAATYVQNVSEQEEKLKWSIEVQRQHSGLGAWIKGKKSNTMRPSKAAQRDSCSDVVAFLYPAAAHMCKVCVEPNCSHGISNDSLRDANATAVGRGRGRGEWG